ncbi:MULTISPECIES: hypothetical protein [unclassified Serratia (in: enterobacteria)]
MLHIWAMQRGGIVRYALLFLITSFLSWAGCDEINSLAERYQSIISSNESGYVVSGNKKVYFYSAPDEGCKIKGLFIVKGDLVNAYADYKGFSSIMYFKKNGEQVSGWIHSDSIKPTGTGIGPKQ